ncbi:MAG: spermidine synthase [Saprospiraceae bacterium]|jgi:spermidine synthase
MKQALWKRLLSYIFELHLESTSSEYNPHLHVSLRDGRYQLSTANAIYSFEDLYDNFTVAFQQIDLNKISGTNVLLLGFGLASVPIILEKQFHKKYHFTGVEIDEEVLYLANKYALDDLTSRFNLICADAYPFVLQCEEQFDLVIMDVFFDDVIPEQFESEIFLDRLKSLTAPGGLLMYNRLAFNKRDIAATKSFYENTFSKVFKDGTFLEVKGNWMLLDRRDLVR